MAQRNNPDAVSFQADGKTYTLICDMNAIVDFERECKVKAFQVLSGDLDDLSAEYQRGLFWAMLQEHHPDITLRQAGRLMTSAKAEMTVAIQGAFPDPAPDTVGKPKASPRRRR